MSIARERGSAIEPLSGIDGAFLTLETRATPMHVGSLHLFKAPRSYNGDFMAAVEAMMEQRMVPVLRRRLASLPLQLANPVWIQGDVDLSQHIRRVRLPAPSGWAQLEAIVGELHAELLDRSRPLWMLYVFDGLASGDQAYYFKIHHAMLDGQSGAALAQALFDTSPHPKAATEAHSAPRHVRKPGTLALVAAAFRHDAAQYVKLVRDLPEVVRTLAGIVRNSGGAADHGATSAAKPRKSLSERFAFGPRTVFNGNITRERAFAATTVSLEDIKALAHAREVSVNEVILAVCGGALRHYLARSGAVPRKSLVASMPISLRESGNTEFRTQATLSLVTLATHLADPLRRLQAVRLSSGNTKNIARKAKRIIPTDFPSIGVPWLLGTLVELYGRSHVSDAIPPLANVLISNVFGPPKPLYVGGLRMTGYWPVSIVEHGVGLNITLMSYDGKLCLGFTAARSAIPDATLLVEDFLTAWEELRRRAGLADTPVKPRKVPVAAPARSPSKRSTGRK